MKQGLMQKPSDQGKLNHPETENGRPDNEGGNDAQVDQLVKQAGTFLYSDRFEQMIKMFKTAGEQGFPNSMAVTLNKAVEELENKNGPIPPEAAAAVAKDLFLMLIEDLILGKVLPKLSVETLYAGLAGAIKMYGETHSDTVTPEQMQQLAQEIASKGGQGMQQQPAQPGAM